VWLTLSPDLSASDWESAEIFAPESTIYDPAEPFALPGTNRLFAKTSSLNREGTLLDISKSC
jgi:hypothetical protein